MPMPWASFGAMLKIVDTSEVIGFTAGHKWTVDEYNNIQD